NQDCREHRGSDGPAASRRGRRLLGLLVRPLLRPRPGRRQGVRFARRPARRRPDEPHVPHGDRGRLHRRPPRGGLQVPQSEREVDLRLRKLFLRVVSDVYQLLIRELGAARVLRGEDKLYSYARDESPNGAFYPEAAVLAESREEVELVLRLAAEHKIPVTPRGLGTGMTGGALPVARGIAPSTQP